MKNVKAYIFKYIAAAGGFLALLTACGDKNDAPTLDDALQQPCVCETVYISDAVSIASPYWLFGQRAPYTI
ncbi:MAG: hypothetical protein FWC16_12165 [Defluviitaleaceae bacterium]|nr:hypothetical protein [Defluviitaleaceae bacterium]MCL2275674.1 hypothetical protein [Defluviitaleaceae bacterium]